MSQHVSGSVLLHSVPRAQMRSIMRTVSAVLGYEPAADWFTQSAQPGGIATRFDWSADSSAGANLASAIAGWKQVWFEVIQDPTDGGLGSRWLCVPGLGLKHRHVDEAGNYLIGEQELSAALERSRGVAFQIQREMQNLLAHRWEIALEPLRISTCESEAKVIFRAS